VQLNNAQAELNGMERELKDNEKALDADIGKIPLCSRMIR